MTDTQQSATAADAQTPSRDEPARAQPDAQAPPGDAAETQRGAQLPRDEPAHASPDAQAPSSEEELRQAYEAELSRITSADLVIQTVVSLLNVGGRRLGLAPGSQGQRDLEQVRDAIDGVRALMPILERRMPSELRPLRDALAQLQMAYAREAAAAPREKPSEPAKEQPAEKPERGPGPAEASGRLWVPGR